MEKSLILPETKQVSSIIISNLSLATSENLSNIPSYYSSVSSMPPIIISIEGIESLLTKLDTNKSVGPDEIPSYILKHCAK